MYEGSKGEGGEGGGRDPVSRTNLNKIPALRILLTKFHWLLI